MIELHYILRCSMLAMKSAKLGNRNNVDLQQLTFMKKIRKLLDVALIFLKFMLHILLQTIC